ncbi:MAG: protein kinase [Gemmataceae bacterium]|nr:protein kinase [Gemmataceae bacterium]
MNLTGYRLLAQLGAGKDGIAYRAQDVASELPVEVRVLSGARSATDRWAWVSKRLHTVAWLEHPAGVRVHELGLEQEPPYVVLDWVSGTNLAAAFGERVPLAVPEGMALVHDLIAALAEAHRLGLAHGRLFPSTLCWAETENVRLDFTGLEVSAAPGVPAFANLDASCRAPEQAATRAATSAADVYSLGAVLLWLLSGRLVPSSAAEPQAQHTVDLTLPSLSHWESDGAAALNALIQTMLAGDPNDRPSAQEVEARLAALRAAPQAALESAAAGALGHRSAAQAVPVAVERTHESLEVNLPCERLGRFRLLEKLGEGGMGAVYRAEDVTDGTVVAIKVLRVDRSQRPEALRRFYKEARLLAEVNNPFVTNLLEVNEDHGTHYLALEFVAGKNLSDWLEQRGRLDEPTALAIMADVARALLDAHERGIVHRDIKPANILLVSGEVVSGGEVREAPSTHHAPLTTHHAPKVKLTDFGLARHVVESESLDVTRAGAILGTPLYMAPEQCSGNATVDARSDVYSMGATLFHLLAGRPPFVGPNPLSVIAMHRNDPPPALQKLNPTVSDGVGQVVEKCLAKPREARYANARALLHDLERLLRGEPAGITVHPRLPKADPTKVLHYDFVFDLEASPAQLWPYVSNTDRLNRAVGIPAVQFQAQVDAERGVRRFGEIHLGGVTLAWEEHPFEWIEGRRMGVLREYSQGPFKWFLSVVELLPRAGGGTSLAHRVRLEPHGLLGRTLAAVQIGIKGRRDVERVYRRMDAALTGKLGSRALVDPFEDPAGLSGARRRRLERLLDKLVERGMDPGVVERLGDFVAEAPAQEVARIRPLALARRLALDPEQLVAACLHGVREGLLVLFWDILCPVCRIPSEVKETLRLLREHGHCEACNLDFELDFANSVEMIFRAHPEIRESELSTYCIGGPAHSPHVVAQVRVAPGERLELEMGLVEGAYRLRGPQLPFALDFRVQPSAALSRWDVPLSRGLDPEWPRILQTDRQVLVLLNDQPHEVVVRVERTAPREDALTAARASALALFRELFPAEILSPGQLVSVTNLTFVVTDLDQAGALYQQLGDARAFGMIHEHFRLLEACIRRAGGALVKTVGEGVLAAFHEPVAAVQAALDLQPVLSQAAATRDLRLRLGVHRGPAMVATLNEHLDYFGTIVNQATQLPQLAQGGELILTEAVTADPQVAALLQTRGLQGEILPASLLGMASGLLQRLVVARSG